jgi:5'-AMP-activated protein kinase catalytic alpha subunit
MFDFIVKNRKLTEKLACNFFHQLVAGVDNLHLHEITHRDLKPEVCFAISSFLKLYFI